MPKMTFESNQGQPEHERVRVIKSGDEGRVAYRLENFGKIFNMQTFDNGNVGAVFVHFPKTGEFKIYDMDSLEYLDR